MAKSAYTRKTKGTVKAPYGLRSDGAPKGKPGRRVGWRSESTKAKAKLPKPPKKKPGVKKKPPKVKKPGDMRGKTRVNRGGLKKDGTPMPASHDANGRIVKGATAKAIGKMGGRPKGSFSMDRLIREELRKLYGSRGAKTKGEELVKRLVDQAITSGMKRSALARFITERMDGKAVQPIKDVTPRDPLDVLSDAEFDELLARRGMPKLSPVVKDPRSSPSPPEERSTEPDSARVTKSAPPPPKTTKTKGK